MLSTVLGMGSKGTLAVLKRCPPLRSDTEVSVESVCERAQVLAQVGGAAAAPACGQPADGLLPFSQCAWAHAHPVIWPAKVQLPWFKRLPSSTATRPTPCSATAPRRP